MISDGANTKHHECAVIWGVRLIMKLQLPTVNVNIEDAEYVIAVQDYALSRAEVQDITSRVGQVFALIGIVPLVVVASAEAPDTGKLLAAIFVPVIVEIAMCMLLWLAFRQVLLVNHLRSLIRYFHEVFRDKKYHHQLLYRFDEASPLTTPFGLGSGGSQPYTVLLLLATTLEPVMNFRGQN